ncbi:MAG: polyhydroxyalkanoic acid system family protein [Gammaproteobacteria bacterium]
MSKIKITRQHQLDDDTVRDKVQALADKLSEELSADYTWEDDRMVFKRSGASGFVRMGVGELEIEIKLGMLLRPLKAMVEKTIVDYLDEKLV